MVKSQPGRYASSGRAGRKASRRSPPHATGGTGRISGQGWSGRRAGGGGRGERSKRGRSSDTIGFAVATRLPQAHLALISGQGGPLTRMRRFLRTRPFPWSSKP